ncbi:MAG: protein kinase [Acidobacteriia bacterium]|nr:protein kinase [Terriglobia bacterium]
MNVYAELLEGKYRVSKKLGGGTFGDVYLATEELVARKVAIKVLRTQDQEHQELLIKEMCYLAEFRHPGIVTYFSHFRFDGRLALVMEYCERGSLRTLAENGPVDETLVMQWVKDLATTLAYVHAKGIAHRDIKPDNIFLTEDAKLKLGDFGVANQHGGTRIYLPPEVLFGEAVQVSDPRIDIYSLGITALELLSGRHPFLGLNPIDMAAAQMRRRYVPGTLSQWIQEVLLRATHPTPELRFQVADDFAEAVAAKHVHYVLDKNSIKADALAREAESLIARRKFRSANKRITQAQHLSPDSVPVQVVAGKYHLNMGRISEAEVCLERALSLNPRTHVQKELAWLHLEQGDYAHAISMLCDHLIRHASDYEAINLLMQCFYDTDRYEILRRMAHFLKGGPLPSSCFANNLFLSQLLISRDPDGALGGISEKDREDPFLVYNLAVAREAPESIKPKLLFEDYRFGVPALNHTGARNTVAITFNGVQRTFSQSIIRVGRLDANDLFLADQSVSRCHCLIVNFREDVWIYDLGSSIGTFLGEARVNRKVRVDSTKEIRLGDLAGEIRPDTSRLV